MSVKMYQNTQNFTDSGVQLSIRAVRSILLYCKDCGDKELSIEQRIQSAEAGQILCDAIVLHMINDLPEKEQKLLLTIFTEISIKLNEWVNDHSTNLVECERTLIKLLNIFGQSS